MEDRIRSLVAELFRDAPRSGKTLELRDEMEQNLLDRYNDLISEGHSPDDAFEEVRSSVGDMGELFEEIERSSVYERRAYGEPEREQTPPASETSGQKVTRPAASEASERDSTQPPVSEPSERESAQPVAPEASGQGNSQPTEEPNIQKTLQITEEPNVPETPQSPAESDVPEEAQSAEDTPSTDAAEPPRHGEPGAATYGAPTNSQPPYYGAYGAPTASPSPDARPGDGGTEISTKRRRKIAGSLNGAMWCLITALYFIVSFATGAWHVTWIMFLLGAGLSCVISYFAGERGSDGRRRVGALNGAMWCLITALYFIMSFQTGAWGMTWLIFPAGACLSSIVGLIASKGDPRAMWRAINGSFWSIVVLLYLAISFATGLWHLTWVIFLVAAAVTNVMHIFRGEKE